MTDEGRRGEFRFKVPDGFLVGYYDIARDKVVKALELTDGSVRELTDAEFIEMKRDLAFLSPPTTETEPAPQIGYKVSVRRSKRMGDGRPLEEVSEVQFIEADDYMVKGRFLLLTKGSELVAAVSDRYLEYVLR